ncbi:Uncharacterised protein [Mycobacteroides abscessus subsp. abscessus]|nr:Uncharacterised protein [Mycobacteroides abscessus subsp. abscessus]
MTAARISECPISVATLAPNGSDSMTLRYPRGPSQSLCSLRAEWTASHGRASTRAKRSATSSGSAYTADIEQLP